MLARTGLPRLLHGRSAINAGRSLFVLAVAVIVGLVGGNIANARGPIRPTYTVAKPADHITFNSITDSIGWGDERDMVRIKDLGGTYDEVRNKNNGSMANSLGFKDEVQFQEGHAYMILMRVHNNASENLNLIARNVKASLFAPTDAGTEAIIQGAISADNCGDSTGDQVSGGHCTFWDEAKIITPKEDPQTFSVKYEPGSGRYYTNDGVHGLTDGTNGDGPSGFQLSDAVWSPSGTEVGYDKLNGLVQGCYKYSGFLTFIVTAKKATPMFSVMKGVRIGDTGYYYSSLDHVKPGQELHYKIEYKNLETDAASGTQYRITVADDFAKSAAAATGYSNGDGEDNSAYSGLVYIQGSAKIKYSKSEKDGVVEEKMDDKWQGGGARAGDYGSRYWDAEHKQWKYPGFIIYYTAKVPDNDQLYCGENKLTNTVRVTAFKDKPADNNVVTEEMLRNAKTRIATATVTVDRTEGCNDPNKPVNPGEPVTPDDKCREKLLDGSKNPLADSEECKKANPGAPAGSTPGGANGSVVPGVPSAGVIGTATASVVLLIGCAALLVYWLGKRDLEKTESDGDSGIKKLFKFKINIKK